MMSNESAKEFSPFVTADGLRASLRMLERFYDNHTKTNCGYEDINGSKYVGVIQNFGSELLLETRKLLMALPSLKNIFVENTFDFYFDIQFSDLINTYDQQSLLVAVLEKDVLLSNKEYRIEFNDCLDTVVLRADSWSDPSVRINKFVQTSTPPTLIISDPEDDSTPEQRIPLILSDETDVDTLYYFAINSATEDIIDTYDKTEQKLITKPLTNNMCGLPFVWMCVDVFRTLKDVNFTDNIYYDGEPILLIGTDGHNINRVYTGINQSFMPRHVKETPDGDVIKGNWYVKVYPAEDGAFVDSGNTENNFGVSIGRISLFVGQAHNETHELFSDYVNDITFDHDAVTMYLSKAANWKFNTPKPGDYDYDGTTYMNPCYAYLQLREEFIENIINSRTRQALKPIFDIEFHDVYHHKYEHLCGGAVSGIHVNSASEYSDTGIPGTNGIIHDLGEFDGLPKYFKYLLDRTINRAHVELYSIRDDFNNDIQKFNDKHTAALILDSAIPQSTDVDDIIDTLEVVIKYDSTVGRSYITTGESISPLNSLSEITFNDINTFGNSSIDTDKNNPKFVYHGNRVFSLSSMSYLDPELEVARVYYVNNDPLAYKNNELVDDKKPPRTMARMCDIPTSYSQITHIEGVAPTIIIDERYVRSEVPFTDIDNNELWNEKPSRIFTSTMNIDIVGARSTTDILIFEDDVNPIDVIGTQDALKQYYPRTINLNSSINLPNTTTRWNIEINDPGVGYNQLDSFTFNMGGHCIRGVVEDVTNGSVSSISFDDSELDFSINVSNLDGPVTIYDTDTVIGSGVGLKVQFVINDTTWESLQPRSAGILDGMMAFSMDVLDNIWVCEYANDTWKRVYQFTGIPVIDNVYDSEDTRMDRTILNVYLHNILNIDHAVSQDGIWDPIVYPKRLTWYTTNTDIPTTENVDSFDWSSGIISGMNMQDSYYFFSDSGSGNYDLMTIECYNPSISSAISGYTNQFIFPRFHEMNLEEYHAKSNMLSYAHLYGNTRTPVVQPTPCVYIPNADTMYTLNDVCFDHLENSRNVPMTFRHLLGSDKDHNDKLMDSKTGILNATLYSYNEYDEPDELVSLRIRLNGMTREELLNYIHEKFETCMPLIYEDTEYAYTDSMLIEYIMQNSYTSPLYKKNDIKPFRQSGEKVVEYVNGEYVGVGEQPKGFYKPIGPDIVNTNIKTDGISNKSSSMFVFAINDDIGSLDGYRITDEMDNDISDNSMLIWNGVAYVFNGTTWIPTTITERD